MCLVIASWLDQKYCTNSKYQNYVCTIKQYDRIVSTIHNLDGQTVVLLHLCGGENELMIILL
jgi:hypothetical protein